MEKDITKQLHELILNTEIELSATHAKLCIPIIDRIARKMRAGIRFSGIRVDKGMICDGHHRYLAALLVNFRLEQIPAISTSATAVIAWNAVPFEEEDWDTPAKIRMLNEEDARYNMVSQEQLAHLLG